VRVTVTDPHGVPLPRAVVALTDALQLKLQRVWTTRDGVAELRMVDPGEQAVRVTAKGFTSHTTKQVAVKAGEVTAVAVTLQPQ